MGYRELLAWQSLGARLPLQAYVLPFGTVILFLAAYCVQPLLVDVIKLNGGAHSSTFSILLPHYYSMIMVGTLPTQQKLTQCNWRKGMLVSSLDIVNQLLKKVYLKHMHLKDMPLLVQLAASAAFAASGFAAGLLYAGAAVYIVIDSSSMACEQRFNFRDDEFIGVVLILLASVLMGLTFVLNEKFMRGQNCIEGPNLVCMMGVCCAIPVTLWSILWTAPRYQELVLDPIIAKSGSLKMWVCCRIWPWVSQTVAHCFFWLFVSGWMHSGTLWYLMTHFGAVSTGILKLQASFTAVNAFAQGLKVAIVFLASHYLFCDIQPNQCLNFWTGTAASLAEDELERQEAYVAQASIVLPPTKVPGSACQQGRWSPLSSQSSGR